LDIADVVVVVVVVDGIAEQRCRPGERWFRLRGLILCGS